MTKDLGQAMRKSILILGHNDATQFIDIYNQYTRLFDKNKYEVTVAYLTGEANENTKARTLAEQVIFLNIPKKQIRYLKLRAINKLLKLCRDKQFHMVICHRYKPMYLMMWVAQFQRIPAFVFVMHELKTMSAFGRQCLAAMLARKNMLFAGVSNAVRDDMRKYLWGIPKERIVTLHNMMDVDLMEPQLLSREAARQALGLATDDFIFGNIGRLAPNKNQAGLIHAFSLIKLYCPKAKLIILGNGELETALKKQAHTYGLEQDVMFKGFVANGFRYMKAFDCFVLSSSQEAFGRVLLEAMLAKIPVIATRVDGIPEVVGEACTLVEAKDSAALAEAMRAIYTLSNEQRAKAGEKAYQHAVSHFSIPQFQRQFSQQPLLAALLN